ncbi:MAG: carbon-nitrogen hydrolase family protein [Pseudomonadota bacterium]
MPTEIEHAVAAIQMEARLADPPHNIAQAGDLAERALRNGAKIVALPEFFTTQIVFDERLWACALPPENPAVEMMMSLARQYGAMIGGSYLELRDGDVFNTYALVEPNGRVHKHDKDQPTMVENAFYVGGGDPGRAETEFGAVGMAVCWETIRRRTVNRLAGSVDLLMTGSHWWTEPGWRFPRGLWRNLHTYNTALMARTPAIFAREVGAPSLHAAHCGPIEGLTLLTSRWGLRSRSRLMGETQIIDRAGKILARRGADEGPGVAEARLEIGAAAPVAAAPADQKAFWLDKLPLVFRLMWTHQNAVGRRAYARAKAEGRLQAYDFTRNAPLDVRGDAP